MAKSFLVSTIILLLVTILESSIFTNISFLLVVPDLVLICSIYFSLLNGKLYGEVSGLTSGLCLDFITGTPFGFNCLLRTIIGYVFGLFSETVIISGVIMPVLSVALGTIFKRLLLLLISLLFPSINVSIYGFITSEFLFEFCANVILAPIVFFFLKFSNNIIQTSSIKDKLDE